MTSAHRPTFVHAIGREKQGKSKIQHDRALPGHKRMKMRGSGQNGDKDSKDSEFKQDTHEPNGDKIIPDEGESDYSQESDDEEELLKELENLKKIEPNKDSVKKEITTTSDTSITKRIEKPSWRNKKRQRSIKSIKNDGNDLIKSDQHAKFMNKYIK